MRALKAALQVWQGIWLAHASPGLGERQSVICLSADLLLSKNQLRCIQGVHQIKRSLQRNPLDAYIPCQDMICSAILLGKQNAKDQIMRLEIQERNSDKG